MSDSLGIENVKEGSLEHTEAESAISGGNTVTTHEMVVVEAPPGKDTMGTQVPDIVASPPQPQEIAVVQMIDAATSPIVPTAPPFIPYTPKRQVKLATSNSSAAAWFATGPISSAKKKDPDPKDTPPTIEISPPEIPQATTPLTMEPVNVEQDTRPVIFNLEEISKAVTQPFVFPEPDQCTPDHGSVMKSEMNMTGVYP